MLARRAVQEYIITSIKEVLRIHFNRAVELKVSPEPGSPRSDMLVGVTPLQAYGFLSFSAHRSPCALGNTSVDLE